MKHNKKLIQYNYMVFVISILFWLLFYVTLLKFFNKNPNIDNYNIKNLYLKYSLYVPVFFWIISLILVLFLNFIKYIFKLKSYIFNFIIYVIVFWLFFMLWIDLLFFEKHDAQLIKIVSNTFSIPLIISSVITILLVLLLCLFWFKSRWK